MKEGLLQTWHDWENKVKELTERETQLREMALVVGLAGWIITKDLPTGDVIVKVRIKQHKAMTS